MKLIAQIALAALTAKSIAWIETGTDGFQSGSRLINYFTSDIQGFDNGTLIYAATPVPVLKRNNEKLSREIVCRLVDVGEAEPEVVGIHQAWVLNKLNGVN